jgi:hypothetical protein
MDYNKDSVKNAEDIDKETYSEYLKKQMNNEATSEMKFAIEKYLYKKNWKVEELTDDFMNKWFRKTYMLHNLRLLLGFDINGEEMPWDETGADLLTIDNETNKKYLNYDKAKQKERIECISNLISFLGFALDDIGKTSMLSKEVYDQNRAIACKDAKIFKDKKLGLLFDMKERTLTTNKACMGFLNNLLHEYGLYIKSDRKSVYDKKTKKKIFTYFYYLDYISDIQIYI